MQRSASSVVCVDDGSDDRVASDVMATGRGGTHTDVCDLDGSGGLVRAAQGRRAGCQTSFGVTGDESAVVETVSVPAFRRHPACK